MPQLYQSQDISSFSTALVRDILACKISSDLLPFQSDEENIAKKILDLEKFSFDRKTLKNVFEKQYHGLQLHSAQSHHLNQIEDAHTYFVVTAHQPVLFTGPSYFIYKILTAIKAADLLNQQHLKHHFIPCYWMGSEDHDKEELLTTTIANQKITWATDQNGAVGEMQLEGIEAVLEEYQKYCHPDFFEKVKTAFRPEKTFASALRSLLQELFSSYGLLVLDGNDLDLKKSFIPFLKEEILKSVCMTEIEKQNHLLEKNSYHLQAKPRAINLFYKEKNKRNRIEKTGDAYHIVDTDKTFTQAEILLEIEQHPDRFSPNVCLRPAFQSHILPTIIFTGGGAELAYWTQQVQLFQHFQVSFPILMLRKIFGIITPKTKKKLEKYNFSPIDFKTDLEALKKQLLATQNTDFFSSAKSSTDAIYDELAQNIKSIDATLEKSVLAEKMKTIKSIEALESKVYSALKRSHEQEIKDLEYIQANLFPQATLQERVENFGTFYQEDLIGFLYEKISLFDQQLDFITV